MPLRDVFFFDCCCRCVTLTVNCLNQFVLCDLWAPSRASQDWFMTRGTWNRSSPRTKNSSPRINCDTLESRTPARPFALRTPLARADAIRRSHSMLSDLHRHKCRRQSTAFTASEVDREGKIHGILWCEDYLLRVVVFPSEGGEGDRCR